MLPSLTIIICPQWEERQMELKVGSSVLFGTGIWFRPSVESRPLTASLVVESGPETSGTSEPMSMSPA